MSDSNESKQISKDLKRLCDCDNSFRINSIANWVELRERYYHGAVQFKEKNQLEKAFHYFHHAILCDPKHIPSYEQLIYVLIDLKKFEHTGYYLNKLNDISPEQTSILRGHVYFARNQYTNSEIQLQLSLNINPTSQKALFLLGLRNLLLNRFDQSEVNFEKLLSINKTHIEAKFCLATIKMFKCNYEAAINDYTKIFFQDPNFYLCSYHIALCYFMLGDYEQSIKSCEQTLKMHHLSRIYELVSMNYFELRDDVGMKRIDEKIMSLYSSKKIKEEVFITNTLIQSFNLILNDPQNCRKVQAKLQNCFSIIQNSQNDDLNEHIERLDYYMSIMNILKTYQDTDELENQPELPLAQFRFHTESLETYKLSNYLYLISLNHLKANNDSLCLKYIDQAINLDKSNINFYLIKNLLHLRKNDMPSSIELLKRICSRIPENNAKLRYFLALAYNKVGKKDQALEHLSHIVSKDWRSETKLSYLNQFIDNDINYELKHSEWFNYSKIFDSMPKLVKEKKLYQHNKHVMDVRRLNLLVRIDYHLYFDLKCVNYLLLKSIAKYENYDLENALSILKKAERLDSDNLGVLTHLALIYLKLEPSKADVYIQNIFDIKRRQTMPRNYLDFYRNKIAKYILENSQVNEKLSDKTKCLVNVSYESFQKAKEIFIDMLEKNSDLNDENTRQTYLDIYAYLVENLHRNHFDNELVYLSTQASNKLGIDLTNFDASKIDFNPSNERSIISRGILYTGISYFNLKDYEKSKQLLDRKFLSKQENLMANFYHNVLLLKLKEINPQIALRNFENILDIYNESKDTDSVLDRPEYDEIELIYFVCLCNFKLKNFDECTRVLKSTYNQLKRNRPKLAYTEDEVIYMNGILNFVDKKYDQTISLFRNLHVQDVEIQNEINFYNSIALYKFNQVKNYESIREALRALEKIDDNFSTQVLDVWNFKMFKLKCLVFLILKAWSENRDDELRLFISKFANEMEQNKIINEKIFYYRIIITSLISQDYTSALEICKEALNTYEKIKFFYYYSGLIAFKLKQNSDAMKYLDKFIDESKSSEILGNNQMVSNSYYYLALINQDMKNYKKSIEYFDSALLNQGSENDPNKRRYLIHDVYNECDLLYYKSLSYLNLSEYEKTMELLDKILELTDKDPKKKAFYSDECKLILARTLIKNKDYKKALKTLKKIINLRSEEKRNQVYYYTGILYYYMDEYSNCLSQFLELPEDFNQDDCGNINLLKLKCFFYLIIKSSKSSQALIKSKLTSYLEQFNELVSTTSLDDIPDMLDAKTLYSILINYKVSHNYEKTFDDSQKALANNSDKIIYLYFSALAKFKEFMNLKFGLTSTERENFLNSSEFFFEKFISLAKSLPGQEYENKIINSYYYLALIAQLKSKYQKSFDLIQLLESFSKQDITDDPNRSQLEKLEIKIDLNEFNTIELDFLRAVVLYNLNKLNESKEIFMDLFRELTGNSLTSSSSSLSDHNLKLSHKNKINISNGVNYYLGAIHHVNSDELDKALEHFQKVKRRYNYFSESRYLIGLIYFMKKNYDQAITHFKGLEIRDFKDFDYGDNLLYYTVKTLFYLAKPEILNKAINSKIQLAKLCEKCDFILKEKNLLDLNEKFFEILVIKTWCLYYSENYEQLYSFLEKKLFPMYEKYADFMFLYGIASIMLFHKFKADAYIEASYKYFLDYILITKKKQQPSLLGEYFTNFDLEVELTSKYYLANVLTTKNYARYEDGIKIFIQILYFKNSKELGDLMDTKQMVNDFLQKSKIDEITQSFPIFREFDVYDLIYYLGVNLNEIEMYEKSFQMLIALANSFKLRDERKANEINFYLGFAKFKQEDYKNASEYFNKYKPMDDEYPKQVPKIELARYYIGICLYNKKDPDFVRAIKKFKEISQDYKDKEELSDLAHYLIDSNYKLALGYYNSNTHGKWNEYFSFTLEVCNEFLVDYNFDFKNFNPIVIEALEKKALSLYYLSQFKILREFLDTHCIKNFPQNIFFYYIKSICLYKLITSEKNNSDEVRLNCDEAIESIQQFITISKETNQETSENKILNLRYIKSVIYLSYPNGSDPKIFLNSMDMIKGVKNEFKSEIKDDDLVVFNTENLEYQEAMINYLSGNYNLSIEQFEEILNKKYFKNDEVKLSDVNYYLALSMIKSKKNADSERKKIIEYLKYVKKESKLYEKSKLYLACELFNLGDLPQAFEFMQSFDKFQNYEEELGHKLDEFRVKIPFYYGNYLMNLRNQVDALDKYKLASLRSTEFLTTFKLEFQKYLSEELTRIDNLQTLPLFQQVFYKIFYFKLWSLFHLKNYNEIIRLVNEYESLSLNLNDLTFLKAFSMFKFNKENNAKVSDLFEQYLNNNNKFPEVIIENLNNLPFSISREEKQLISLYCLAEINKPNFDKEYALLSSLLSTINSNYEIETLSLNDLIKQCRKSQSIFNLNVINLTDIVYKWLHAFYLVNSKIGAYEQIHVKLSEIIDEFDASANFFSHNQKDNLIFFLGKAIFEHFKIEQSENLQKSLQEKFENLSENFKKIKINSEFYTESLQLLAEFNYELNKAENLDKSIYYLDKLISSTLKNNNVEDADYLLVKCYEKKIVSGVDSELINSDYIKFNDLFDRLKLHTSSRVKELAYLTKLKLDLKFIKFKNETILKVAQEANIQFPLNLEILFYKGKLEFLNNLSWHTAINSFLHNCKEDSYPGAKFHIQESQYYMLKWQIPGLDEQDYRDRLGHSIYVNRLIKELDTSLSQYKSDDLDLNLIYYDFGLAHFKDLGYTECINKLKRIQEPSTTYSDNSNEYNLSFYYFMLGVSEMITNTSDLTIALNILNHISRKSNYYEKGLLCSIHLNYKMGNYEHIIKTYPSLLLSLSSSKYIFDYQAYVISSRFWLSFNNYAKLAQELKEIETNHFTRDDMYNFYRSFIKLWIGVSNDFSSVKFVPQSMPNVEYDSISKAAFMETNEINFVNGVILYSQKSYALASSLFDKFLKSESSNSKCRILTKFYNSHSSYYLLKDKLNESRDDLKKDYEVKLRNIIGTMQDEIMDSEYFSNSQKELNLLLGNIFFDLMILTRSKSEAENSIKCLNKYFEPNMEYDEKTRTKIGICQFNLENYTECLEMFDKIKQTDLDIKYYSSLCHKNLNSMSKALDLINEVVESYKQLEFNKSRRINDVYYQRGLIYKNMPEPSYNKALGDFLEQVKIDEYHCLAYKNILEVIELMKQNEIANNTFIGEKDLILFNLKVLFGIGEDKTDYLNKVNELISSSMSGKEEDDGLIYFSYNMASKDKVFAIYNLMLKLGFRCYIDKENFSVALNEKQENMLVLEKSDIFLSFLTPEYSESAIGIAEIKKASEEDIEILPIVLRYPQSYVNELKLLRDRNQLDKKVEILGHFSSIKEYCENDALSFDMGNLDEQEFTEENLLNNQVMASLVIKIINLFFE
ncbi:unnamed protein product [Brachionus calyciflorus]|uniref:Uncharacterized protein n=1 Tax=Brachionus calyciflorus TaxID=104777 RepID=A0A813M738_9BILA|nr:unnamed protein product [Brachionus calyciflorus]